MVSIPALMHGPLGYTGYPPWSEGPPGGPAFSHGSEGGPCTRIPGTIPESYMKGVGAPTWSDIDPNPHIWSLGIPRTPALD